MTKLLRTCVKVSSGPAVLGAVAVMFFACQVRGQDTVQLSTNYYVVSGATLGEMRQSMRQSRPWKGQSPLEGMTDWRITWQFNLTPAGDGCRCSSFITKTSIATTLPAWMAPTNATPAVRTVWQRYITRCGSTRTVTHSWPWPPPRRFASASAKSARAWTAKA
jgi:predicted secreted Zn-dependent protease